MTDHPRSGDGAATTTTSATTAAAAAGEAEDAFAALGGWPGVLGRLFAHHDLSADEAALALGEVLVGAATPAQIASFVTALRIKGETIHEMTGLVRAMLANAEPLPVPRPEDVVDTCGTGGDRSRSINVSTIAALVVAGAGARVCKHGGRAATSAAGSADVLEALGVVIDLGPAGVARCIEEAGHRVLLRAPLPSRHALRHPGAARARGAHRLQLPRPPGQPGARRPPGRRRERPRHGRQDARRPRGQREPAGHGGPRGRRSRRAVDHGSLHRARGRPRRRGPSLHRRPHRPRAGPRLTRGVARWGRRDQRRGGAARPGGEKGPHRDIAVLNAAAGLVVAGLSADLAEGVERAGAVIDDGAARHALDRLVASSQDAAATSS